MEPLDDFNRDAHTPGSAPSRVASPTFPAHGFTGLIAPAAWARLLAAVTIVTRRARTVAPGAVPAGLTAITGAIGGGAEATTLAGTAPRNNRANWRDG